MKSFVFFFINCIDFKPWRLYPAQSKRMCETGTAAEQSDRLLLFCVIDEIKKTTQKKRLLF